MKTKNITFGLIFSLLIITGSLQATNDTYFGEVRGNAEDAVYTIYIDPAGFEIGDEVAIFDGSKLVGATAIVSENPFDNFIPIFATLNQGTGYIPGNPITFKVYQKNENEVMRDVHFTFEPITPEAHTSVVFPSTDAAYSFASLKQGSTTEGSEILVYPNPADGITYVQSNEHIEKLAVYNGNGQLIFQSYGNGNKFELNTTHFMPGVYNLRVQINGQYINKRLIIK